MPRGCVVGSGLSRPQPQRSPLFFSVWFGAHKKMENALLPNTLKPFNPQSASLLSHSPYVPGTKYISNQSEPPIQEQSHTPFLVRLGETLGSVVPPFLSLTCFSLLVTVGSSHLVSFVS